MKTHVARPDGSGSADDDTVFAAASFGQERLWFLQQLEPTAAAYNMPGAVRLRGALDAPALEQALNAVVARHEVLRTTFAVVDGELLQCIAAALEVVLGSTDLGDAPPDEREGQLTRLKAEEAQRPFDLAVGPLLRATLVRVSSDDHVLLLTMHHIVSDGWSISVLVRELAAFYDAHTRAEPSRLPELPIQYADYAAWQRSWLSGAVLEVQLTYWREKLAGAAPLELPTDRPRPPLRGHTGAQVPVEIGPGLMDRLRELSRREGVTPFMTLLAAWQALLARYSGQNDIVVGSPIAGRTRPEVEGLIGFFVNTLALRTTVSARSTFRELLLQVRETCLGAYAHQDVPFARLVEELQPQRDLSRTPLFQVMFVLQNAPQAELALGALELEVLPLDDTASKFDLILELTERQDRALVGTITYDGALFDAETIEALRASYSTLLTSAVEEPDGDVWLLELVGPAERRRLMCDLDATSAPPPQAPTLHLSFFEQARLTPERAACVWGETAVTYAELARQAWAVAGHLVARGVGAGSVVGVTMRRTPAMIAALLGVLRAGAAYLPLDPTWPRDRLSYMLTDSGCELLITDRTLQDSLPGSLPRLCMDDLGAQATVDPSMGDPAAPDDLAYILYTSGSTGLPKGIEVSHRSAVEMVEWSRRTFGDEELGGLLAGTSISWDLSVFELFVPLSCGGTVLLADSVLSLPEMPARDRVRLINTVPSAMQALVRLGAVPTSVKTVNLAGEPLSLALAQDIHALGHVDRLFNLYGPSEDTTYSTWELVPRDLQRSPSIGRPISNTQTYVLSSGLRLLPVGAAGELFIGGNGLARAYHRRPGLTAERFVPDSFGNLPGRRVYRTGDMARLRHDGALDYLGRRDAQVKVNGFRIELGDVEAAVLSHPAVEAVCASVRDVETHSAIVAYVVTSADVGHAQLAEWTKQRVPGYMVPSFFVTLDALPLTPSGKVDRKALPDHRRALPEPPQTSGTNGRVLPRNEQEEIVAGIFCEVLRLDVVGVHESFFELGGHSLLATRVVSRLRSALGLELPLRELFEHPTVAGLSLRTSAARRGELPLIAKRSAHEHVPASLMQQRLWILHQLNPESRAYNLGTILRLEGELDLGAWHASLCEVAARHESLRTRFSFDGETVWQDLSEPADVPLPLAEAPNEEDALREAREHHRQPFDLEKGPLFRVHLWRVADGLHLFSIAAHHIITDGWSNSLVVRELGESYAARREGRAPRLAEVTLDYGDFAVWQRRELGDRLNDQLGYWKEELAGAPRALELPTDRPRPMEARHRGAQVEHRLPGNLAAGVRDMARREGATLFMVLLSAYCVVLSRLSGQREVVVGTPIAGRGQPGTESIVGFFMNTLALRVDCSPSLSFSELLRQVRVTSLDGYANQDLNFERLVEVLRPERDLTRTPIFQSMLNMLNQPTARLDLSGLSVEQLRSDDLPAKVEVELYAQDDADGLDLTLVYDADLFDVSTASTMMRQFVHVLEQVVDEPSTSLNAVRLTSAAEVAALQESGRRPRTTGAWSAPSIAHRFVEQAMDCADATAVITDNRHVTYGALLTMARRVASSVSRASSGSRPVGILAGHDEVMLASLLGVLMVGGSYVPLDPHHPMPRLAQIVSDAGCELVLVDHEAVPVADVPATLKLVPIRDELETSPPWEGDLVAQGDGYAYILYTSGTTGSPKGVLQSQRNVLRHAQTYAESIGLTRGDRIPLLAPYIFDASVMDIYGALLTGATLCPIDPRKSAPHEIVEALRRHEVSILHATPTMFRLIAGELQSTGQRLESVRAVVLGGEEVVGHDLEMFRQVVSLREAVLVNGFGPTESTMAAQFVVTPSTRVEGVRVPIGYPVADTDVVIVDAQGRPADLLCAGEIVIRSPHVALGYWGDEELTNRKFAQSADTDIREYRSGDLGRIRSDGGIEFLGRGDDQVKIRGIRIELGEVRSAIISLEGVRDCAVVARPGGDGAPSLVAYVVAEADVDLEPRLLRRELERRLPSALIPGSFKLLAELPLTATGKIDRRALPEPDPPEPVSLGAAPQNELERLVAGAWEEVLGRVVGRDTNFFDAGGSSLQVAQVRSRLFRSLGRGVPVVAFFQYPTIRALADYLAGAARPGTMTRDGAARGTARREAALRRRPGRSGT